MSNENNNPRRTGSPWALPSNSGPRIGRVGAWSSTPSSSNSSRPSSGGGGRRIATLGDLSSGGAPAGGHAGHGHGAGGHGGHGHAHGDDEDEDEDDGPGNQGADWYAGGERSGISVQNPGRPDAAVPGGDLVRNLLRRAAEAGPPEPRAGPAATRGRTFIGGGHTLGSDEIDSTYIPDPTGQDDEHEEETAIRHLTFWRNGFSVEDGELMRYDDPANEGILSEIDAGHAPPQILNVRPGQPVELRVVRRLQDDYVPPKAKAFSGQGHRLGSPIPGASTSTPEPAPEIPGAFPSGSAGGSSLPAQRSADNFGTRFEVDQTKPTTSVQIRLADGTRMVARMNLTHTVGDIRNFINASRPENLSRPYLIMTTFPNRTLEDNSQTIEAAGLVNSVVVQRWA